MTSMTIGEIAKILPHRYPMLMVDRIVEITDTSIVGIKNVTVNEPHFTGHFPEYPVMPGVLIVEAMAQVGGLLLSHVAPQTHNKLMLLAAVENAKFRRPVVPGDQLRIEMKLIRMKASVVKMEGVATVDGLLVAEAGMMCKLIDQPSVAVAPVPAVTS
jgi:3-hydroxyacyl-[acyl-carrier-protein] dehydratase